MLLAVSPIYQMVPYNSNVVLGPNKVDITDIQYHGKTTPLPTPIMALLFRLVLVKFHIYNEVRICLRCLGVSLSQFFAPRYSDDGSDIIKFDPIS